MLVKGRKADVLVDTDEHPRADTTVEVLAGLRPVMSKQDPGATVTAGNASGQNDGAAICVVTTQDPETGVKDWPTLTQIAKQRHRIPDGLPFGMYAVVTRPGLVQVGDTVQVP